MARARSKRYTREQVLIREAICAGVPTAEISRVVRAVARDHPEWDLTESRRWADWRGGEVDDTPSE